jgi:hypothetical protein
LPMSGALALALVVVGLASVACGVALAWFAWWLGGWGEEMAWPFHLGVLAFGLVFLIGGIAAIRAGIRTEDESKSN